MQQSEISWYIISYHRPLWQKNRLKVGTNKPKLKVGLERYQERHPISNNIVLKRYQYPIPVPILVYSIAMTTKNPKTLWWWQWLCLINSSVSAWCPDKRLQLSEYKSKAGLNNHSLACGCALWLVLYWVSEQQKISPNNDTTYYLWILPSTQYQYRSNPI